jgi:transposase
MSRVSCALPHLSAEEIKEKIATASTPRRQQKWLIVYNALVAPRPAAEIAEHTATHIRTVHQVISDYNRFGAAAIETAAHGGRRHEYLSEAEEREFLAPFITQGERGELTTIGEIHQAFNERVGRLVHSSTIYRLLARHGWRKIAPRPFHPETDIAAQEAFKKTSPNTFNWLSPTAASQIPAPSC